MAQLGSEKPCKHQKKKQPKVCSHHKKRLQYITGPNGEKIPLKKQYISALFDKLGKETYEAVEVLEKFGGIPQEDLKPGPEKCCCWGTPIGDRLLMLVEDIDRNDSMLLAQTHGMGHTVMQADTLVDTDKNDHNLLKVVEEIIGSTGKSKGKK